MLNKLVHDLEMGSYYQTYAMHLRMAARELNVSLDEVKNIALKVLQKK